MPIKKQFVKALSASKRTSDKADPKLSPLAREIVQGFEEGIAHFRGQVTLSARTILIPENVDVTAVRRKTSLSQSQFADRFGFSLRTLQEWEQGRSAPDTAVRAYLLVIDRQPKAVDRALGS